MKERDAEQDHGKENEVERNPGDFNDFSCTGRHGDCGNQQRGKCYSAK